MPITDPISLTARLTAAARARETRRPDHLFEGRALVTVAWDGQSLRVHEMEDPEDATSRMKLTYI